jgi:hypothetical protein
VGFRSVAPGNRQPEERRKDQHVDQRPYRIGKRLLESVRSNLTGILIQSSSHSNDNDQRTVHDTDASDSPVRTDASCGRQYCLRDEQYDPAAIYRGM